MPLFSKLRKQPEVLESNSRFYVKDPNPLCESFDSGMISDLSLDADRSGSISPPAAEYSAGQRLDDLEDNDAVAEGVSPIIPDDASNHSDDEDHHDEEPTLRGPKEHKPLDRQRSMDVNAVLSGFTMETIEYRLEDDKIGYVHTVTDIEETSILNKFDIRPYDCILRINFRSTLDMTMADVQKELSLNLVKFDLMVGKPVCSDGETLEKLETITYCFSIRKIFRQRDSSDRVSGTACYEVVFHETVELDDDLEEDDDGYDDTKRVFAILKSIGCTTYLIKHDVKYLQFANGGVQLMKLDKPPSDSKFHFQVSRFQFIDKRSFITRLGCVLKPVERLGTSIAATPTDVHNRTAVDEPDGTNDSVFWIRDVARRSLKAFESSEYPGHFLCVNTDNIVLKTVPDYEVEARAHFSWHDVNANILSRRLASL